MRKIFTRLTLAPAAALSAGALALAVAGPAGATVTTSNLGGYQAGNGSWNFRYIQTEFIVPQNACSNDDFDGAGLQLAGNTNSVAVGVGCDGSVPEAGYQFGYHGTTWSNTWTYTTRCAADDLIFASLYYNQSNNYVALRETDLTTGQTLVNDSDMAYGAMYHWASALAQVNVPLSYAPPPGLSYVLVPFTDTTVTSYNGTHGSSGGITGPWGVTNVRAMNGAHVDLDAPVLFGSGGGAGNSFNVREYGNS